MSKMHSSRRGKSGSSKPMNPETDWVNYDEQQVKDLVIKLKKKGMNKSEIGRTLRDQYGIPSVREITGQKMTEIIEEEGLERNIPEDMYNLLKKVKKLKNHLEENENDLHSKRNLKLAEEKVRRLAKYYKEKGKIPETWEYKREKAEQLLDSSA